MTFNIQHGLLWERQEIDLSAFADYIKAQNPDICGLNEVRGKGTTDPDYTNQTSFIAAAADYNGYFGQSVRINGTDPYGNAILSKNSFKSAETLHIPDPDTGKWNETRSVIKAVTEIEGKEICFLVSHFGLTDEEKQNAVATVCELIDSTDMPLVLMGDFNMCPDDEILVPIRARLSDTDELSEKGGTYTFASYKPERKIDYIFYRGLTCTKCETLTDTVSDHFPIIAEFTL